MPLKTFILRDLRPVDADHIPPIEYWLVDHRMTIRSNPRILLLFLIILGMLAVTILGFVFLSAVYGVIFLAVCVFLSYQFLRFAASHMRSRLHTDESGITFFMPTKEEERFEWEEISNAGICTQAKGRPFAFIYSRERDRLITVPKEYERFPEFLEGLERRVSFAQYELGSGVTIQEKLREELGLNDGEDEVLTDRGSSASGDGAETGGDRPQDAT